jgi:molybdopterin converting factor small subunit
VNIGVKLYSILRDCLPPDAKEGKATVILADGSTVADLVTHLGIHRRLRCKATEIVTRAGWLVMVNGKFALDVGRALQEGDEVIIFPQVGGG